jgi:hypothetical protein
LPSKQKRAELFEIEAQLQLRTFRMIKHALGARDGERPVIYPYRASAEFVGFKTRPEEIQLGFSRLTIRVELLQVSMYVYLARFQEGGAAISSFRDGRAIRGKLNHVKKEVAARFDDQVTPWSWVNKSGRPCEEPVSK